MVVSDLRFKNVLKKKLYTRLYFIKIQIYLKITNYTEEHKLEQK